MLRSLPRVTGFEIDDPLVIGHLNNGPQRDLTTEKRLFTDRFSTHVENVPFDFSKIQNVVQNCQILMSPMQTSLLASKD
ncbi:hypothetical protein MRX96_058276 [Rhipicephalus microplus]